MKLCFFLFFAALQLSCPVTAFDIDTICGGGCTAADNASASHDLNEAACSFSYQQSIITVEQCGNDFEQIRSGYLFHCSQTESGKYCGEFNILNPDIPACEDRSTCTAECFLFLAEQGDSGCCTDLYLTDFGAMERTSCPIAEKCHLTVDQIPRRTGSMQCNSTAYSIDRESYCTIRPDLIQKTVNKLYANSCLRVSVYLFYGLCDQYKNGTYCDIPIEVSYDLYLKCRLITKDCTSNCRNALISAKETNGCCANSLLYSNYIFLKNTCETRMDLWSICGVESPGFCNNQLVFGSTIGGSTSGGSTSLSCVMELLVVLLLIATAII